MNLYPDCYPCLIKQALSTSKLVGLNKEQTENAVNWVMQTILDNSHKNLTAPHVAAWLFQYIRQEFFEGADDFDPYRNIKKENNLLAMSCLPDVNKMVCESMTPLETAIKVAAGGNIIDFGVKSHETLDVEQEIRGIPELSFSIFDMDELTACLEKGGKLLYLGDNAGEIVFDRVLIRELRRLYPSLDITFAVRGMPVINDAVMEDAEFVGIHEEAVVISNGSIYPGTVLSETSNEFQNLFNRADTIISKGQGNYETLSDIQRNNVFFILRVKCELVADNIGASTGDLVLCKNSFI